ncbi:MAG: stage III sporulation protein AB [Clostridia bacterium]|nr:stage III sporulation protein AB [Clostridia bacterium]
MLKITGALFIIVATSMWGINVYRDLKLKAEITNGCIKAIFALKENIRFSMENLYQSIALCVKSSGRAKEIFECAIEQTEKGLNPSDALKYALESNKHIGNNTRNIMLYMCSQIGTTDAEGQILMLEKCMHDLENEQTEENEIIKTKGILYQKCGIVSGILIAIILI